MIFLDTYCLVKMAKNEKYLAGVKSKGAVTLSTNLAEFHYIILKNFGEEIADELIKLYVSIVRPMDLSTITKAMKWRLNHRSFSYNDALGYQYALSNDMKFITGNIAFKGMKNVFIER